MLWLKILLSCLIIAFSVGIGYLAGNKYRCRRSFYAQFYDFNEKYLHELDYTRKPLPEFIKTFPATGDFRKVLDEFARTRKTEAGYSYLTQDEKRECGDYFSMLGRGDAQSQSGYFSARRAPLGEKKAACEQEAKARNQLYLKLGLLAGLAFVILII